MRSRSFFLTLVLSVVFILSGTAHGQDIPALLSKSLDEAPSLETLGSGKGTVILRDINFRLLADGRTERITTLFLHEGEELPDRWRNWEIVIPEGGEASVLESALYDPNSRRLRFPLIPREIERGGVRVIEVRFPNSFEGNILALSYREVFPTRMNLEDAVPIDLDLAQWEQRISLELPPDLVRNPDSIPAEGPWTVWEASFLLGNWLRRAGWSVEACWDSRVSLGDLSPATVKAWRKPVLSVTPPGGKPFIFEIGQAVKPGSMPPGLWGRTLYSLDGSTPLRNTLPSGGPGDHRLSVNWVIEVAPDGMATGELAITAGGAWVEVVNGDGAIGEDTAARMLASFAWPSIPGFSFQGASVETPGTGLRVKVPLHARVAIPGGEGLLLRMPSVMMPWQRSIAEKRDAGDIRFPFVFEQAASIRLPEGFKVMVLPATRPYDTGQVKLEESMRVRKGSILVAEQKTVVSTARLEEQARQALANVVRQQLGWIEATVPLKKR